MHRLALPCHIAIRLVDTHPLFLGHRLLPDWALKQFQPISHVNLLICLFLLLLRSLLLWLRGLLRSDSSNHLLMLFIFLLVVLLIETFTRAQHPIDYIVFYVWSMVCGDATVRLVVIPCHFVQVQGVVWLLKGKFVFLEFLLILLSWVLPDCRGLRGHHNVLWHVIRLGWIVVVEEQLIHLETHKPPTLSH